MAYQIGVKKKIADATPELFEHIVKTVPVMPAEARIVMAAYGVIEPELGLGGESTSKRDKYLADVAYDRGYDKSH